MFSTRDAFRVVSCALAVSFTGAPEARAQSHIYTTFCFEACSLRRYNIDGSGAQLLAGSETALAVDDMNGKIYFGGDFFLNPGTLQRAALDGTMQETLISGVGSVFSISVDPLGGKVYFAVSGAIRRANLDGSAPETILTEIIVRDLDVDPFGEKLYWTSGPVGNPSSAVKRADLDGSDQETLLTEAELGPFDAGAIAVNPAGKLYVADGDGGRIFWANLDGSNPATILDSSDIPGFSPFGIALADAIYFMASSEDVNSGVWSFSGDGTIELLIPYQGQLGSFADLDVDRPPGAVVPASSTASMVVLAVLLLLAGSCTLARRGAKRTG